MTALRAVAYVRLSEDTETTTSPQRQREVTAAYAKARGWTLVDTIEDIDVSATHARLDRPGLTRLRSRVAEGGIDVVIVWRLDRLARKVLDVLTLLDEWTKHGTAVASATEPVDLTTAAGRAMASLIAIFAEMEAEAIRERVTASINALRHAGRFSGGTVPYGYRTAPNADGPGVVLVPEATEVAVLVEISARVLGGESPWRVCRDLNARGVPSPRSEARRLSRAGRSTEGAHRGAWKTTSLKTTLTSDHLLGRQTHRGDVIRDEAGLPATVWPPLLPRTTVEALRALLASSGTSTPRRKRTRLLSGLLVCDGCSKPLYVATSRGNVAYRCMSKSVGGTCDSPTVSAARAEEAVVEEVLRTHGALPITETVSEESPLTIAARTALLDVEVAISETSTRLADDDADVAALLSRLVTLKAERTRLRAETEAGAVLSVIVDTGRVWADEWEAAESLDARQALLSSVVSRVRLVGFTPEARVFDPARLVVEFVPDDITEVSVA